MDESASRMCYSYLLVCIGKLLKLLITPRVKTPSLLPPPIVGHHLLGKKRNNTDGSSNHGASPYPSFTTSVLGTPL